MLLGVALTEHCNLRCPHCIRDDVTHVRTLEPGVFESILDQARALFGPVVASLTGGEPLLHPEFERIVAICAEREVLYRFVTNAWHLKRAIPVLDRYPPQSVRLSLSGADEAVHDAERGAGSFRRVLLAVALLTSRRVPTYLSIVIDRRDRHQIREAADLAESLGCNGISFILPQPVPGSAARDSDLPPDGWLPVRRMVEALAAEPGRRSKIAMDYGAPFEGLEQPCDTFGLKRVYIDTRGRMCTCCQLSCYGFNETEVVADLNETALADAYGSYFERLDALRAAQRPDPETPAVTDAFPCLRCARSSGKLQWLRDYPGSPWHEAAAGAVATRAVR
ncbi:MAG: radical SAM protein [Gemmatimonadales bacterium]|jgi:MoaA/NifB/PqqE/SkfB family radical SAM enzyme